jgi:hypothetical protein
MHIDFECSGGYANLKLTYRVDTDSLPQELGEEILRLIEDANGFDIQPDTVAPKSAGPPDVFVYRLSLSDGKRKQSLSCNDVTAPANLRPLLALFRKLALDQRRQGQ